MGEVIRIDFGAKKRLDIKTFPISELTRQEIRELYARQAAELEFARSRGLDVDIYERVLSDTTTMLRPGLSWGEVMEMDDMSRRALDKLMNSEE